MLEDDNDRVAESGGNNLTDAAGAVQAMSSLALGRGVAKVKRPFMEERRDI